MIDNKNIQFKHNHKRDKQFYIENPHTNCGDKKLWGLRPLKW